MRPQEVVDILTVRLKDMGFRLLYYKSMSSDSHYIKIDGGVAYSIRISDHHSKKKLLSYRYNVITTISGSDVRWWVHEGHKRFLFGPETIHKLLGMIKVESRVKKSILGSRYKEVVQEAFIECKNHKKLYRFNEI